MPMNFLCRDDVTSASAEETLDADEDTDDWDIASRPAWGRKTRNRGSSKKSKHSRKRRSGYDDDFGINLSINFVLLAGKTVKSRKYSNLLSK